MKRGDIVLAALPKLGEPRPALIVQSDLFAALPTVSVLLLTGELRRWPQFRVDVTPTRANGLRKASQVMVDHGLTIWRARIGARIGRLDRATLTTVDRALAVFLGIA